VAILIQTNTAPIKATSEELISSNKSEYDLTKMDFVRNSNVIVLGNSQNDLLIADRQRQEQEARQKRETLARSSSSLRYDTAGNSYKAGYCTWYVKQIRPQTPNGLGNAYEWPVNSQTPSVGAVVKTRESRLGHVAYVQSVGNGTITIREMNYRGRYVVSERTIPIESWFIIGYYI